LASPEVPKKRAVTREEYFRELGLLSAKRRQYRRLRSRYYAILGHISGLARERSRLIRHIPYARIIERVRIGERIREIDRERALFIEEMRRIRTFEAAPLLADIKEERKKLAEKIVPPPPPKLYRIKIRLYTEERKPTPTGMFQAWFDIDARLDPKTGLVDWTWWLTRDEVEICKYHMIGYFKGMAKWRGPEQIGLAYFFEKETKEKGIPTPETRIAYKQPYESYAPGIPTEFISKAERLTTKDLILGESSVEPKPITNLEEESGIFFEKVMIIDEGMVKWHEERNRWIWHLPPEYIERVKSELAIK